MKSNSEGICSELLQNLILISLFIAGGGLATFTVLNLRVSKMVFSFLELMLGMSIKAIFIVSLVKI